MKVWVAEFSGGDVVTKFELFVNREDAMVRAADMMTAEYKREGDACEGDDVPEFRTIDNYGGKTVFQERVRIHDRSSSARSSRHRR